MMHTKYKIYFLIFFGMLNHAMSFCHIFVFLLKMQTWFFWKNLAMFILKNVMYILKDWFLLFFYFFTKKPGLYNTEKASHVYKFIILNIKYKMAKSDLKGPKLIEK
jgi:hypothetical protein